MDFLFEFDCRTDECDGYSSITEDDDDLMDDSELDDDIDMFGSF